MSALGRKLSNGVSGPRCHKSANNSLSERPWQPFIKPTGNRGLINI